MTLFEELKARGIIAQTTNEEKIKDMLDNQKITFYVGFDATADSLHAGHFFVLSIMSRLQRAGHRPIALIGGATTLLGDPTGKTDMRKMLTKEQISHNADCFKKQMSKFIDFSDDKAIMVNNADWLCEFNYLDFLREIGVHFSVNRMLAAECYKSRLENGLSFLEFNYTILQSYDFLVLNRKYGCKLEVGGDDQWSNIINGEDLIRRLDGNEAYGMTFTLLTNSEGKKMGKTEKGALWLDADKTTPYEFFQYWRNVQDADVIKCLKMLTFVPLEEIAEYEKLTGSELNPIKELLAFEMTKMVHGEAEAIKARESAKSVFSSGSGENMPSTKLNDDDLVNGSILITDLLLKCGLCPSKSEARRLIEQGGILINGEKAAAASQSFSKQQLSDGIVIKKGKKVFHKAEY